MCALTRCMLVSLLCIALVGIGCSQEKPAPVEPKPGEMVISPKVQPRQEMDPLNVLAVIETNKGTMEMEFLPGAPKTNKHIAELIQKKFYNLGMTFFRVDEGVIQTGDPTNTGYEGSSTTIELEVWEGQMFRVGSVGMARSDDDPDSARSQFFICKQVHPELNKDYTLFGQVISGLDVIQTIEKDDKLVQITLKPKEVSE